ncbi:MAG TPA: response regulator transcription factor [Chthoniobacteraceae bacterium]|nr:response regulator transcription factor [Chthoniobacteraceae bacterium]
MKTKPPRAGGPARAQRKVLLLDDHPVVREALAMRIDREADLTVCATIDKARQALGAIEKHQPDLAIIDLSLPDGHGLEVLKDLRSTHPELRVLVFSMHDENLYGERALKSGAHGYVMKDESPESVLRAIRRVLSGEIAVSPRLANRMLKSAVSGGTGERTSIESLSDRELEIFQLMGGGLETKEIASRLHLGIKTIETFRARIKRKLGIGSISELIALAARSMAMSRL